MSLKFLPLAVVIWLIVAWFELPRSASWGFAGVVMMYAFLLSLPPKKKTEEKSFGQNIKFKLPIIIVIGGAIWFLAGKLGFPVWWQIEFVTFAFVGLAFFLLLDSRTLKPEKSKSSWVFRLLTTYALAS